MNKIQPLHYDIHLTPDLPNFKFSGEIDVHLKAMDKVDKVTLHALDLNFHQIRLDSEDLEFDVSLQDQQVVITLPQALDGEFILSIKYAGEINDKLAGLYRSKFQIDGEDHFVGVTQFQETDARRAFPCFDSPEYKTTYDISFTVPEDYDTISNTSIVETKQLGEGRKHVVFERTPKMSSYLVFFGFGQFEMIEEQYKDIPIRVITAPGKTQYGETAMDYGKKSLKYCEEYFNIDYPLSKMDLIATPDFAAGAMENWGAILFRENALLVYPGVTTQQGITSIKNVIAHEIAHQWFGNLVSPDKWKYVWLNESFATYFAYKTIEHYEPEFGIFDYFISGTTKGAMSADAYHETAPIEQEGDEAAAYTVKTIPILYSKGGSVLRQLEGFLGNEMFRKGLEHYLNKHQYDVAGSDDLWAAFEEVSGEPISDMMQQWVMQLGYPFVSVSREDNELTLSQQRFTIIPKEYDTTWLIPITLRQYLSDGSSNDSVHLMREKSMTIKLDNDCEQFKINIDHTGFYRVLYNTAMYDRFGELITSKTLTPIDRYNLENDLYAFVRRGDIHLDFYLDFLKYFENEKNHLPLGSIAEHLNSLYIILEGEWQEKIAKVGRKFYGNFLEEFGYEDQEDESHTITMLRGNIINQAAKFGLEEAKKFALKQLDQIKAGEQVDPNTIIAVLAIVARETDDWEWLVSQFEQAEAEAEKQYYLIALSSLQSPENIEKVQEYIFEKVPSRNRGTSIAVLCSNEKAKDSIWEWYLANIDNFEKLHPFIYQSALRNVIIASVKFREDIVEFFEEYVKKNPQVQDPVDKALENLDMRAQLLEKYNN